MAIVITGASGHLGRRTAELVLERSDPSQVILVTRHPDRLEGFAERGVAVRHGDFAAPATLPQAFAGGERMLLISTDKVGIRVAQHQAAIDAAVAAGVRTLAYTSMVNPSDSNPAVVANEHRATEEAIRAAGLRWTFLRHGIYAEVLVRSAAVALATSTLLTNEGDGRTSYVARDDCAAVAAAVLTTDGHDHKAYDITGPEALSPADVAVIMSEVGGRPVDPEYVDDPTWIAEMIDHAGLPGPIAEDLATFGVAARHHYLAPISAAVRDLTGRPPRTLGEVLDAHVAELA